MSERDVGRGCHRGQIHVQHSRRAVAGLPQCSHDIECVFPHHVFQRGIEWFRYRFTALAAVGFPARRRA